MQILRAALARWQPGAALRSDPLSTIQDLWRDIVGGELAAHCAPKSIERDALVVVTDSSAWSQQLSFLSERLLEALSSAGVSGVRTLRFRVGRVRQRQPVRGTSRPPRSPRSREERPPAQTLSEALDRFRGDVAASQRAKASAGWKECRRCGVRMAPRSASTCVACQNAIGDERSAKIARLLFEAPWLGYAGVASLVEDTSEQEYSVARRRLLARWWETLTRLRRSGRTSATTRERLIASSFVLLKSGLDPDHLAPAVVRDLLGDELHGILYLGES